MKEILKIVEAHKDYVINLRREFHEHPELGLQEFWTAARIEKELDAFGIEHERIGETGVFGKIYGGKGAGKVIVLRADIDALAIQETNPVAYASKIEGRMHACGHDAHNACLLTAAKILQDNKHLFCGEVRLCFQQAEEIGAGAKQFIAANILDGAGRVFGFHIAPDIDSGVIGVKKGINNASVDHFKIHVKGRAAHVSTPHKGVDALYISSQIVVALQALVSRRTSPIEPLIIGVGLLEAGTAYNIVAENGVLEGTVRACSHGTRAQAKADITRLAADIAQIYGGKADIAWTDFTSPLINDDAVCDEVVDLITRHWGKEFVTTARELSLGGDDIAEFLLKAPGAYAFLGTGNDQNAHTRLPAHNGGFDIDEEALPKGVGLHVLYALEWLENT